MKSQLRIASRHASAVHHSFSSHSSPPPFPTGSRAEVASCGSPSAWIDGCFSVESREVPLLRYFHLSDLCAESQQFRHHRIRMACMREMASDSEETRRRGQIVPFNLTATFSDHGTLYKPVLNAKVYRCWMIGTTASRRGPKDIQAPLASRPSRKLSTHAFARRIDPTQGMAKGTRAVFGSNSQERSALGLGGHRNGPDDLIPALFGCPYFLEIIHDL
ncbi:hypothetical protein BJ508DRAFT_308557 [Ascobolus immersus RN42]|uniref:Uncharacterized protein n=1 Tax=Ascobolus immersus RN42 TaxID=1160509 RepID=A0A3N4I1M8_ASCIM|nr:hypothetical protein BJ508DRAFT_308557 [Ascobolus immersus RN42]